MNELESETVEKLLAEWNEVFRAYQQEVEAEKEQHEVSE